MTDYVQRLLKQLRREIDNGNLMEAGESVDMLTATLTTSTVKTDITVTPWKPVQGEPICLTVSTHYNEEISKIASMFIVGDVREVRWQRGHVKKTDKPEYDGNGHYVMK